MGVRGPHRLPLLLLLCLACGGSASSDGADGGADQDGDGGAPDADPGPAFDVVFDLDRLHEIDIQVDEAYLDQLENDRENRVPCTITFDGTVMANSGIRQKGGYGSSSNLDGKPGFSIKFNEIVPGQTLFGLHKLLLNNAQEDATFLSEHIGYEVHRRAGRPATFTAHGIVTLNGFTYGLYVVKEAVAEDFLERSFGRPNDSGNVYEGFYHPDDQSLGDFVTHPEELDLKDEIEEMRTRDDVEALAAAIDDTPDGEFETTIGA
ncbi:MAG TPA: CotH kinase family protein, partial [Kofleriaceae bacterium]